MVTMQYDAWAAVPGSPEYSVSASGTVMRWMGGVPGATAGRILKATPDRDGYMLASIHSCGERRRMAKVHQLVLEAFVGPRGKGMETLHINGVRSDNRLSNLRWGTRAENMATQSRRGGSSKGEANKSSKLTDDRVMHIYSSDLSYAELTALHGVSEATVWRIRKGYSWTHVTGQR